MQCHRSYAHFLPLSISEMSMSLDDGMRLNSSFVTSDSILFSLADSVIGYKGEKCIEHDVYVHINTHSNNLNSKILNVQMVLHALHK